MTAPTLPQTKAGLRRANQWLASQGVDTRVAWALDTLPETHVLSSSFGAQSAVSLHLITRHRPGIQVLLVDTGFLFPETYRFIDELVQRLSLNLHVTRPELSPAWLEARHGRLWERGTHGIEQYNRMAKVEPMQHALENLGARTWFAGLRRQQSSSRRNINFLEQRQQHWKVHPLADWTDQDIGLYMRRNKLPWHPLWEKGYVSIGDVHTTRPWQPGMREEETRFHGLKRECGLHL